MSGPADTKPTPMILIGDQVTDDSYLTNFVDTVRAENSRLPAEQRIAYLLCSEYDDFAVSLKRHRDTVRLILVGPHYEGKPDMLARLLGTETPVILALDPNVRTFAENPDDNRRIQESLEAIGSIMVQAEDATADFYRPFIQDHVVAGLSSTLDLSRLSPELRASLLDRRLETVTAFPTLPATQRRVAELDDADPPREWAAAIDPDVPVRTVILNLLNSVHYGFRHRVETIEQAVSLASARVIREIVLACTVQRLFRKISQARVNQFWQHSVATGLFAQLFSLPTETVDRTPQQKADLDRFALEEKPLESLRELQLWQQFDLEEEPDPFTTGLLHDIGKITMALCFEDALLLLDPLVEDGVRTCDQQGVLWAESCRSLERSLMGDMDHELIGGRIAGRWGLSERTRQVVSRHHEPPEATPTLVNLVALADLAANTIFPYPVVPSRAPLPRLFHRLGRTLEKEGRTSTKSIRELIDGALAAEFESVLRGLEVPDTLWTGVDRTGFLTLCYLLGPKIRKKTLSFLQLTATSA